MIVASICGWKNTLWHWTNESVIDVFLMWRCVLCAAEDAASRRGAATGARQREERRLPGQRANQELSEAAQSIPSLRCPQRRSTSRVSTILLIYNPLMKPLADARRKQTNQEKNFVRRRLWAVVMKKTNQKSAEKGKVNQALSTKVLQRISVEKESILFVNGKYEHS